MPKSRKSALFTEEMTDRSASLSGVWVRLYEKDGRPYRVRFRARLVRDKSLIADTIRAHLSAPGKLWSMGTGEIVDWDLQSQDVHDGLWTSLVKVVKSTAR